ncbi:MAG: outer membrane protein assembly factor BamE [Candidatus Berkiellales bacterium]
MKKIVPTFFKIILWLCLSVCLNACFIHPFKFDIDQGNVITADKVAEIHPGMSQEQVRYMLGTPMLVDIFHPNRWDYIYIDIPGKGKETRRHFAIFFVDGQVDHVKHDPAS